MIYLDGNTKMLNQSGKGFLALNLTFSDPDLARLCNTQASLERWSAGGGALMRLLNELHCIERFEDVRRLPHLDVVVASPSDSRVAVRDVEQACVLLHLEKPADGLAHADAATVVAVAVGEKECNPEGELWP
jgi:hypothetical protein